MVDIMLAHVHRRSKLTLGWVVHGLLMGSDSSRAPLPPHIPGSMPPSLAGAELGSS